ncbi:FadR/GntR family transcriptional regulator [Phytohalomonas tamaricis]|uniref:FadR/GntR family transcriptional regulator n=1 Tax=Phytohalomonas tamaricis TaxID=2081032 RepID=UPI000D0BCFAE|nr:FadR/GntR family transcriptional regulator [Phytohalomonas tamaricis]
MDYQSPRQRKSLHARIVQELGMKIVTGEFSPGEKLPHESQLLKEYDVSRSALREATRVLVAKGLVYSKPRVGAVVRPRSEWHLLDPDVLFWLVSSTPEADFFAELFSVRCIIEPAAAAMAATCASAEDIAGIEDAYQRMEAARSRDELLQPDLDFHRRIAEATNNDMLTYLCNMLSQALRESIKLSSRRPDTQTLSLPRHKAILTALQNRDALGARQATLVQLEGARMDIEEVLGHSASLPADLLSWVH